MSDHIALLLHMHQPDYRHPRGGRPVMPWVRLHACRGYTDVATLALEAGVAPTVNVVPTLLDQLAGYANGATDRWEELSRVPAEDLDRGARAFLRLRFAHGHPAMRQTSPRYRDLEARLATLDDAQDLRDLQVWSNLAWMGVVARRDPFTAGLIRQDHDFSHSQLIALMDRQRAIVADVLPLWRRLEGLSCTPYNHPILPLLADFESARRALPHVPPRSVDFAWPEDARRQVDEGLDRVEAVLGRRPTGMWPSEGSVSPEIARTLAESGLRWAATDEAVLQRSLHTGKPDTGLAWEVDGADLVMIFRDRALSDRIGFNYATWDGAEAAADLLGEVQGRGIVPVILDGENPWESFPDAGESFLTALFASGQVLGIDEALPRMERGKIRHLHTGSWIDGDFAIWAGAEIDRVAWRHLARVRRAWEDAGRPEAAWPHIRAAEGSDWFWWYGPEHHSEMHDLFDRLFREHVMAAWEAMGQPAPLGLDLPVRG
jgi:alpha-amylase/alpha-mannosidase (GH57 family)